jgi:hypothetical protein
MRSDDTPAVFKGFFHLYLRGRHPRPLVEDDRDWLALGAILERTLFWCGEKILGCRCEGREMRFAVQASQASVGVMARNISGAYGIYLRRRRGRGGNVFNHYVAIALDTELYLDDLVLWLHRPPNLSAPAPEAPAACWTADLVYRIPYSLGWMTTEPVLAALSPSGAGRSAYLRRVSQPMAPEIVAILNGGLGRRFRGPKAGKAPHVMHRLGDASDRLSVEKIAQFVAEYSHVSYEDMCSESRARAVSRAKAVAAVLCVRRGSSVAAVARLFGRSRSTVIERAERYRQIQPQLFARAERALNTYDRQ